MHQLSLSYYQFPYSIFGDLGDFALHIGQASSNSQVLMLEGLFEIDLDMGWTDANRRTGSHTDGLVDSPDIKVFSDSKTRDGLNKRLSPSRLEIAPFFRRVDVVVISRSIRL